MSIKLSEAIQLLRDDLMAAIEAARVGGPLTFEVTSTEVELTVVLTHEATAGGKLTWSLIPAVLSGEASAQGKLGHSDSHKVKLTIKPLYQGSAPYVSRRSERPEPGT
jgi:hypothetical protein